MFIGDISIDTIVDGNLIYDSTCLHHWLVVSGTMEFDDFPYTGNSNPN